MVKPSEERFPRHFILDLSTHTAMLACKNFNGRHTAANIRHVYEEMVSSYVIGHKIKTILTDNASNMTKAFNFSLPGYVENVYKTSPDDDASDDTDLEPVGTSSTGRTYGPEFCGGKHSAAADTHKCSVDMDE